MRKTRILTLTLPRHGSSPRCGWNCSRGEPRSHMTNLGRRGTGRYGKVRCVHGGAEAARTHLHEDGGGAQRCTRRRSSCLAWLSLMIRKSQSDMQRSLLLRDLINLVFFGYGLIDWEFRVLDFGENERQSTATVVTSACYRVEKLVSFIGIGIWMIHIFSIWFNS